jgi:NAD(P)-dependent dehydrogenase (short-subunit alcohol dehydrogenase family)
MSGELSGKVALVTGAARGIGAGVAIALGAAGASVLVNYVSQPEKAREVAGQITRRGGIAECFGANVGNPDQLQGLVAYAASCLGGIDILVNNAGVHNHLPVESLSLEEWRRLMSINLDAPFLLSQLVLPHMRQQGWGRVINISSIDAFAGTAVEAHYGASKAGIVGLTRALALEAAGDGVTVNAIAPGCVDTDMLAVNSAERHAALVAGIPVGRLGAPQDIAHAVLFLASPHAGWITGQVIHVNGGEGLF